MKLFKFAYLMRPHHLHTSIVSTASSVVGLSVTCFLGMFQFTAILSVNVREIRTR